MTRVLSVDAAGNLWGSERALLDLVVAAKDVEFAVCCPPGKPLEAEFRRRGVRTLPYFIDDLHHKPRWRRLQAAFGLLRACLAFRPDVIHLNQSGAYKVALPAARLLRLPILAHVRIFEDAAYLAKQNVERLRAMIAISRAIEDEIATLPALAPVGRHRIYDVYIPAGAGAATARNARKAACVGRVMPTKGQDILIGALTLLKNENIACDIAGEGDARFTQMLKTKVADARLSGLAWLGNVFDPVDLLRSCAVLACPSWREPLGRVILEAWDAGAVPVVYAGSSGAAEIVAASGGGILYEEQTPQALAKALLAAVNLEDSERETFVARGRAWMAENCGAVAAGGAFSDLIAGVRRN